MWPREVINSSKWDFWATKSGCVNGSQWQQQSVFPATHLNPSHWAFIPFSGHKPRSCMITSIPLNHPGIVGWSWPKYKSWLFWSSPNLVVCILGPFLWCVQAGCRFFGIFRADKALGAHFWWLGALSNRNNPVANPFFFPLKMSIAVSICCNRSSPENHPSQFFPALNITWASLTTKLLIKLSSAKHSHCAHTCHHLSTAPIQPLKNQIPWWIALLPFSLPLPFPSRVPTLFSCGHSHRMLTHHEWQEWGRIAHLGLQIPVAVR